MCRISYSFTQQESRWLKQLVAVSDSIMASKRLLKKHMNIQDLDHIKAEGIRLIMHTVWHKHRGLKGLFPCCTALWKWTDAVSGWFGAVEESRTEKSSVHFPPQTRCLWFLQQFVICSVQRELIPLHGNMTAHSVDHEQHVTFISVLSHFICAFMTQSLDMVGVTLFFSYQFYTLDSQTQLPINIQYSVEQLHWFQIWKAIGVAICLVLKSCIVQLILA